MLLHLISLEKNLFKFSKQCSLKMTNLPNTDLVEELDFYEPIHYQYMQLTQQIGFNLL